MTRQLYEYHPVIGMRFVPELRARVPHQGGGYLLHTNEQGFRCRHSFVAPRREGVRRILLFGDSFTAGEGVSDGFRFGDLLERALPGVEVYNFGLPATGTDQHFLVAREYARSLERDLVIVAVFVENIRRVGSRYRYFEDHRGREVLYAKPYFTLEGGKLQLRGVPPRKAPLREQDLDPEEREWIFALSRYPGLRSQYQRLAKHPTLRRLVIEGGLMEGAQRLLGYQPVPEYRDAELPAWQVMRAVLEEWAAGESAPMMIMPIPLHQHVLGISSPRDYQARLREAAVGGGVGFWDPLEDLAAHGRDEARSFYYPGDGHLTRAGHAALAAALVPQVARCLEGRGDTP